MRKETDWRTLKKIENQIFSLFISTQLKKKIIKL